MGVPNLICCVSESCIGHPLLHRQLWLGLFTQSAGEPGNWYHYKGNEYMSYEEIRTSFLQYYEKRLKLQLLRTELAEIMMNAEQLTVQDYREQPPLGEFSLTVLETTLADTYTILMSKPELLEK